MDISPTMLFETNSMENQVYVIYILGIHMPQKKKWLTQ